MMKSVSALLVILLLVLQFRTWFGESSASALDQLELQLQQQRQANVNLEDRNRQLEIEILDLKNGLEAVEERARAELGMIGKDEIFFLIVE